MKRQLLSAIFLSAVILSGLLSLPGEFRVAGATAIVYIRADGSVDPSTAPIQRVQDVYTFSGDVNASLIVQRDSIIVDGAGHTLRGGSNGTGVDLTGRSNVTVKDLEITGFQNGVYLSYSYNNTLSNNNITANSEYGIQSNFWNACIWQRDSQQQHNIKQWRWRRPYQSGFKLHSPNRQFIVAANAEGIHLYASAHDVLSGNNVTANEGVGINLATSSNTTLRNNSMAQNRYNFAFMAYFMDWFLSCDIDTSNTVESKPISYWINKKETTVPSDAGYIALINCSGITVKGLNLTNNGQGLWLFTALNCTITQNNIANNQFGLKLISSPNNTITFNNLTGNDDPYGIQADNSNFTYVCYNNVAGDDGDHPSGIDFEGASTNTVIRYNNLTNSNVEFLAGQNNDVSYNYIINGGVALTSNGNATVSSNKMINPGSDEAIYLDGLNSIVSNNYVATSDDGIWLDGGGAAIQCPTTRSQTT